MATLTLRQMLVRTLINIGEPLASTNVPAVGTPITDSYQLQVCNFINHIKEECEQYHQWSPRWQTYQMAYISGNITQRIVDATGVFVPIGAYPYSDASVVRIKNPKFGREVALVFDITTFGIPFVLDEMPLPDILYYNTVLNQTPVAYSTNFCIQDLGNDTVNMLMYPGANSNRTIQITLYNPQQYIDPTATVGGITSGNATDIWNTGGGANGVMGADSPIVMPSRIIELGSAWYCLEERGETLGASSMFSEDKYRKSMDDLAGKDQAEQGDLVMVVA